MFLAGFNLLVLQYVVIREHTVLLRGTELAITGAIAAFLLGSSLGYYFSGALAGQWFPLVSASFFLLHLTVPFSFRVLSSGLLSVGCGPLAPPALLIMSVVGLSGYYSVFLPMFIRKSLPALAGQGLARCYTLELIGALGAMIAIAAFGASQFQLMMTYHIAFLALLALLGVRRELVFLSTMAVAGVALVYRPLEHVTLAMVYQEIYGVDGGRPLTMVDSPYQRIEVVADDNGDRYLYLNGLRHYQSGTADEFNRHLVQVPARVTGAKRILTVGSGSLASVALIGPQATSIRNVEIDAAVVEVSRKWFADINQLQQAHNWAVTYDDGKHFLANSCNAYDLIILDVPSPFTIQTALLHSREFFEIVKQRLGSEGVLSMGLSGSLPRGNLVSRHIAATVCDVFDKVLFIDNTNIGATFVMAGPGLSRCEHKVDQYLRSNNLSCEVIPTSRAEELIGNMRPIRSSSLQVVLETGIIRLIEAYYQTPERDPDAS